MPLRPCLTCGALSRGSRCPTHTREVQAIRDAKRGTTNERGLGAEHQRQRRALIDAAGPIMNCPRCDRPITAKNPLTGEHGVARAHGGTELTGLICRSCNSSLGATIRANR
jgi:hypothetical protein